MCGRMSEIPLQPRKHARQVAAQISRRERLLQILEVTGLRCCSNFGVCGGAFPCSVVRGGDQDHPAIVKTETRAGPAGGADENLKPQPRGTRAAPAAPRGRAPRPRAPGTTVSGTRKIPSDRCIPRSRIVDTNHHVHDSSIHSLRTELAAVRGDDFIHFLRLPSWSCGACEARRPAPASRLPPAPAPPAHFCVIIPDPPYFCPPKMLLF